MSILLFIIMLVVLIVGHEFGHFIAAKLSGMKVPEFGIGFPPKLWGKKIGDTEYTINALPFGGFVKIEGEDATEDSDEPSAFSNRPKILQIATLVAGPFSNLLIAFILSSLAFMVGLPAVVDGTDTGSALLNPHVVVAEVLPKSPAELSGLKTGDHILSISAGGALTSVVKPEDVNAAVSSAAGAVSVSVERAGQTLSFEMTPKAGVVTEEPDKKAIGIASALVGTEKLSFLSAVSKGFTETITNIQNVFSGLVGLIASAFTLSADISNIAGPVGIAGLAGDAAAFGVGSFLSFAALISINLGILNLLPFPALDGGRLALLIIETVIRRRIPVGVSNAINFGGFAILIILMLAVTAHDIFKLFT